MNYLSIGLITIALVLIIYHSYHPDKRLFLFSSLTLVVAGLSQLFISFTLLKLWFVLGISFSFLGDLMMARWLKVTRKKIIDGILFFSVAHLSYFFGVNSVFPVVFSPLYLVSLVLLTFLFFLLITYDPNKRLLSIASVIYILLITNLFLSVAIQLSSFTLPLILLFIGVTFFMISDGQIGWREFRGDFKNSEIYISFFYIVGQSFILLFPIFH